MSGKEQRAESWLRSSVLSGKAIPFSGEELTKFAKELD
jgi:hypothetical protein